MLNEFLMNLIFTMTGSQNFPIDKFHMNTNCVIQIMLSYCRASNFLRISCLKRGALVAKVCAFPKNAQAHFMLRRKVPRSRHSLISSKESSISLRPSRNISKAAISLEGMKRRGTG